MDSQGIGDAAFGSTDSSSDSDPSGSSGAQGSSSSYGKVFGDVMQFIGSMLAEDAATKQYQYNSAVTAHNAKLAGAAAEDALRRGNIQAGLLRIGGTKATASQAVAYTGGGVDATTGTAEINAEATAGVSELDAQTAANNAAREAFGFKQQEKNFQDKGTQQLADWTAQNQAYDVNQIGTIGKFGFDAAATGG